jgi:NitT/TauT family transport system substrate-binding protein
MIEWWLNHLANTDKIKKENLISCFLLLVNLIWPSDYGIHFYSDTLITMQQVIDEKPDLVERFLRASLKGWRYAIAHPVEAVDRNLNMPGSRIMNSRPTCLPPCPPLAHTGKDNIGWMEARVWQNMHRVLVDQHILEDPIEVLDKTYTLKFLRKYTADKP